MPGRIATNTAPRVRRSPAGRPRGECRPSAEWTGAPGSGGAAQAHDQTVHGTGWDSRPAAQFDAPPHSYVEPGEVATVTVGADHPNPDWLDWVALHADGLPSFVTQPSDSPETGATGFVFTIPTAGLPEGTLRLYARARPHRGRDRVIGPIYLHVVAEANRPKRWVSPTGSDAAPGTSEGTAWATVEHAVSAAPSGALVYLTAGNHNQFVGQQLPASYPARPVELRPAPGLTKADVTVGRMDDDATYPDWRSGGGNVILRDVKLEISGLRMFWMVNDAIWTVIDSEIKATKWMERDAWAGLPTADGRWQVGHTTNWTPWRATGGQRWTFIGCTASVPAFAGAERIINSELDSYGDVAVTRTEMTMFNVKVRQPFGEPCRIRTHNPRDITVASATYDVGTNRTTLVFSEAGSEFLGGSGPDNIVKFLTGSLAPSPKFVVYSAVAGSNTMVVTGNASTAVAGNKARAQYEMHSDLLQTQATVASASDASLGIENIFFQRVQTVEGNLQVIPQCGEANMPGTISTVGTTLTTSEPHLLREGYIVKIGAHKRQVKRVPLPLDPASTTAELYEAFPADVVAQSWMRGGAWRSAAFQLCTDLESIGFCQWSGNYLGVTLRRNTWKGLRHWMRMEALTMATREFVAVDTVAAQIDSPGSAQASDYVIGVNSHTGDGDILADSSGGAFTVNPATFKLTSGVTRKVSAESARILPTDLHGEPVTAGVTLIGAAG